MVGPRNPGQPETIGRRVGWAAAEVAVTVGPCAVVAALAIGGMALAQARDGTSLRPPARPLRRCRW